MTTNSYKTTITDQSGNTHLAEWVSTTPRPAAEREEIARAMGRVILSQVGSELEREVDPYLRLRMAR